MTHPDPTDRETDREERRLTALHAMKVLDTPFDAVVDSFTRLAAGLWEVPIAAVSLVDRDRQWFKSVRGLDVRETPRSHSFCAHAILAPDRPFVVEDTHDDVRFRDNPLVTGGPRIRFYASAAVRDEHGLPLGSLCVIDQRPRKADARGLEQLTDLATGVSAALQLGATMNRLRDAAQHDRLTGLLNREGLHDSLARHTGTGLAVVLVDIDRLKTVNDTWGHAAGDALLVAAAHRLRACAPAGALVARWGGDEFVAALPGGGEWQAQGVATAVESAFGKPFLWQGRRLPLSGAVGVAATADAATLVDDLIKRADLGLYASKRRGRAPPPLIGQEGFSRRMAFR